LGRGRPDHRRPGPAAGCDEGKRPRAARGLAPLSPTPCRRDGAPRRFRFHNAAQMISTVTPSATQGHLAGPGGAITDVAGIEVGHFSDARRPTGCTVVIAREGAVAGVDVRGAAPGTRETDLLAPGNLVQQVHAVLLAGGSAWGLAAADGAMRWLEEHGAGLDVRFGTLPIVPAAVLFDLPLGDARIRPDADAGYAACEAASD